jgi:hypothetical protein
MGMDLQRNKEESPSIDNPPSSIINQLFPQITIGSDQRDSQRDSAQGQRETNAIPSTAAEAATAASGKHPVADAAEKEKIKDVQAGKMKPVEKIPLTRTETILANSLHTALSNSNVQSIQDNLGALSEQNQQSRDRILSHLRDRLSDASLGQTQLAWEQGTNSANGSFVRITLSNFDRASRGTEVTIGSDGRNSATYTAKFGQTPRPVTPEEGLRATIPPAKAEQTWENMRRMQQEFYPRENAPLPQPLPNKTPDQPRGSAPADTTTNKEPAQRARQIKEMQEAERNLTPQY